MTNGDYIVMNIFVAIYFLIVTNLFFWRNFKTLPRIDLLLGSVLGVALSLTLPQIVGGVLLVNSGSGEMLSFIMVVEFLASLPMLVSISRAGVGSEN